MVCWCRICENGIWVAKFFRVVISFCLSSGGEIRYEGKRIKIGKKIRITKYTTLLRKQKWRESQMNRKT